MIWSSSEIWTCQNHYFGYDVCAECHNDTVKKVENGKKRLNAAQAIANEENGGQTTQKIAV